jgi:hypothetical protein
VLAFALSIFLALAFEPQKGFVAEPPKSSMQVARWKLPGDEAGPDASLVVYYFGAGQGGSADDNVKRWTGQFPEKDGEPKVEKAKTKSGLAMTIVDVAGTMHASQPMGGPPEHHEGWRMIGAIIEAPDGNYFVKATGPKAIVAKWEAAIRAFLESAKP